MLVEIEEYRGFNIYFDRSKEDFIVQSINEDWQKEKSSYAAAKKFVDQYIKDNIDFKPFEVNDKGGKTYKLLGIRKDGRFIKEDAEGKLSQVSDYQLKDLFYKHPKNEQIFKRIDELNEVLNNARIEQNDLRKQLIIKNVNPKDYKI